MFHFKFTQSEDDYLEFNKFFLTTPAGKDSIRRDNLYFILMSLVLFLLLAFLSRDFLFFGVSWLVVSIIHFFLARPLAWRRVKSHIKSAKKNGTFLYEKEEVIFDFEGLTFTETTVDTETKMEYTKIKRIVANNNEFYLFVSNAQAYIIPFYVFDSPEHRDEFFDFINSKIGVTE